MGSGAYFSVYQNSQHKGDVHIDSSVFTIGRSRNCNIGIGEAAVSRLHAQVTYQNGHYRVQDMNSSGGILINNQPSSGAILNENDVVQVGQTQLQFHMVPQQNVAGAAIHKVRESFKVASTPQGQPQSYVPYGPASNNQFAQALASTKSYIGPAIIILLGYTVAPALLGVPWLIAMVFNVMYLTEAKRMERMAGMPISGTGCLQVLLAYAVISLLAVIFFILMLVGAVGSIFN